MKSSFAWLPLALLFPAAAAAQWDSAPPAPQRPYAQVAPTQRDEPQGPAKMEGLELSLGLGAGLPMGDLMKNSSGASLSMSDGISGELPLLLGLGYRTGPMFSFGAIFQYAIASTKNCDTGLSCSASDTRFGLEGRFHFNVQESFSPWISLGVGYEWFNLGASGGGESMDMTLKGLDFDFQIGGDFRVGPIMTLGPFLSFRVGTFDSASVSMTGSSSADGDIPDANQSSHQWVAVGVRGTFTL